MPEDLTALRADDEIERAIARYRQLREAEKLLEAVFLDVGTYGERQISTENLRALQRYFKFDDSE